MKVEKALIEACAKQERKAQFELYKACYGVLMSVCFRYKTNKEDAEEVLNIGFLKILNSINKYQFNVPFEAWIRRIMINTLIDEYRKNKKDKETMDFVDMSESKVGADQLDANSADLEFDAEDLLKMLEKLPDMSKRVFNLYAIDGYTHKEIADMLNMSEGTSKWHVSFARAELRKIMDRSKIRSEL